MSGLTKRERLSAALTEVLGHAVEPKNLFGSRGWYRHRRADVMPWTGVFSMAGVSRSIGCWRTMTACIKHGFAVFCDLGERGSYADYDVQPFDDGSGMGPSDPPFPREVGRWLPTRLAALKSQEKKNG